MKIQPYVDKLHNSSEFKKFEEEHKDAYIAAGFFVLDFEGGKNVHQLDYYVPKHKKVAAFTLDHGVVMQMLSLLNSKVPEKLDLKTNIDLVALKGILEEEMKNRNMTEDIKKIIAILQTVDNKRIWNLNCVLSGLHILRAHVEDSSKTVLKMEKASIMDYVKRMPGMANQAGQMQSQQLQMSNSEDGEAPQPQQANTQSKAPAPAQSKQQTEAELKKLEQIEQAIAKEKAELQKKLKKN